jgi:hypothetical protein
VRASWRPRLLLLGVGMVAAVVATDGALLLRARNRTQRHVPRPPSCLARST